MFGSEAGSAHPPQSAVGMVPVRPDQTARVATELGGSMRYYEPWLLGQSAPSVQQKHLHEPAAKATTPAASSKPRLWLYVVVGSAAAIATYIAVRKLAAAKSARPAGTPKEASAKARAASPAASAVQRDASASSGGSVPDDLGTWERVDSGGFAATAAVLARADSVEAPGSSSIGYSLTSNTTTSSAPGSFVAGGNDAAAGKVSGGTRAAVRVTSDDDFVLVDHNPSPEKAPRGARGSSE